MDQKGEVRKWKLLVDNFSEEVTVGGAGKNEWPLGRVMRSREKKTYICV